ncbi:MAG: hypothetical protein E7058_00330 [Lentisphaerae bacterium]|nr:hypothetical protein [Lentisphaerota bacterium]
MVTLKKDIIHVYDRFEQETEERILNGSLKAGDCIISGNDAAAYYKISRRSARTATHTAVCGCSDVLRQVQVCRLQPSIPDGMIVNPTFPSSSSQNAVMSLN